jgi:hypothetical protein
MSARVTTKSRASPVLVRERGQGQIAVGQVDALVVAEAGLALARPRDLEGHRPPVAPRDGHGGEPPVVEEHPVPDPHRRQDLGQGDPDGAVSGARAEGQSVADPQAPALAGRAHRARVGAREVAVEATASARPAAGLVEVVGDAHPVRLRPLGQVEAEDPHPGLEEGHEPIDGDVLAVEGHHHPRLAIRGRRTEQPVGVSVEEGPPPREGDGGRGERRLRGLGQGRPGPLDGVEAGQHRRLAAPEAREAELVQRLLEGPQIAAPQREVVEEVLGAVPVGRGHAGQRAVVPFGEASRVRHQGAEGR